MFLSSKNRCKVIMASVERPTSPGEELDLGSLSREELRELDEQIDRELEAREFEAKLKRELEYHVRKQARQKRNPGHQGR